MNSCPSVNHPVSSESKTAWLIASLNSAPATLLLYCFVNFAYNVFSLLVTKHGSAILMVVSAALALPLTNIAFASEVLMGDDAEPFTEWDVAALLVVVFGFLEFLAVECRGTSLLRVVL